MAAPLLLAVLALLAAGTRSWRGDPRSRLTADDVRTMGLDPDEHGFTETPRWRGVALTIASVLAPIAPPLLALLAVRPPETTAARLLTPAHRRDILPNSVRHYEQRLGLELG